MQSHGSAADARQSSVQGQHREKFLRRGFAKCVPGYSGNVEHLPDPSHQHPRAVCLLSGGLDSSTCLALARRDGFECYALSFDYGQRHRVELEAAERVARSLGAARASGGAHRSSRVRQSALTDDIAVPKNRTRKQIPAEIPVTYVPARNTIFLSFALAWAEMLECSDIFIGVNAIDYSGYPDCRPEFHRGIRAHGQSGDEGRRGRAHAVRIHTPLIQLSKAEIVKLGTELGRRFRLTHSCYDPDARADGRAARATLVCCAARASKRPE